MDSDYRTLNKKMRLNFFTLSFGHGMDDLEKQFRISFCNKSLVQIRLILVIGIIMYAIFGVFDAAIFPDDKILLRCIRYALVCPAIITVLAFSYSDRFSDYMQLVMTSLIVLASSGIIVMGLKAPLPLNFSYFAGIVIALMFGYTLAKIRFIYATIAGWLVFLIYEIATMNIDSSMSIVFFSNNCFFISANIVGMLACYSIEFYARRDFYLAYLLGKEEEKTRLINSELEARVEKKTIELRNALLKQAEMQTQIIKTEKIAELGTLVAGIAHEINTPVGAGITAASFLEYKLKHLMKKKETGRYSEEDLLKFFSVTNEGLALLQRNLQKTADLIKMFMLVAVSDSSENQIKIGLKNFLEEIIKEVYKSDKGKHYTIMIECPEDLEIKNSPENFALVVSNIVRNAFQHGFKGRSAGALVLEVSSDGDTISMEFCDNGNGMDKDSVSKLFNPFYTTARPEGHTGLGMHIAHCIVSRMFSGSIQCESSPGDGTRVIVKFPVALTGQAESLPCFEDKNFCFSSVS